MVIFIVAQHNALCNKLTVALSAAKIVSGRHLLSYFKKITGLGVRIAIRTPKPRFQKIKIAGR